MQFCDAQMWMEKEARESCLVIPYRRWIPDRIREMLAVEPEGEVYSDRYLNDWEERP